ncbi:GntP family permease [Paracoccus sp. (in: a-proteobacteria)]|uniref:GntP family permease n=1 Tax=Paracoccus sp. TaxID=267 RepID=UPI00272C0D6D|nr:GntP family permease [Paracoccus sp. (in: a-proteobacteria)]
MTGLIGILIALVLLILLVYRGLSVLIAAPLAAALAAAFSGVPVLAALTQLMMPGMGSFIVQFMLLFLLGAIFGKLMEDTGAARVLALSLAERLGPTHTIPAVVLACAVLTYGGVSLFVVAFAVAPLAAELFARAGLPRRLIPATIALGAFTFTMSALPGTPAIQNAIPMPFFGTTAFAAPGLGFLGAAVMLAFGLGWLLWRARSGALADDAEPVAAAPMSRRMRELAQGEGFDIAEARQDGVAPDNLPPIWLAALPILAVVVLNGLFVWLVLPLFDSAFLAEPRWGETTFERVRGVWAIILALTLTIVLIVLTNRSRLPALTDSLSAGAGAAALPLLSTAVLVGFGTVVAALPAFAVVRDAVLGVVPGSPLVSLALSMNVLAGITGSASGGMSIALATMGDDYLARGLAAGIAPEVMHRVASIASGGLDALPQNGAVVTLLSVCRLTHRQAYADIFMVACVGPLLALVVVVLVAA